jgi:predicted Rossmann-fold nucleotide-binding protein
VILPGGFGTMDEFFEVLTLVQTKKTVDFPLIVMGKEYYGDLRELLEGMIKASTINPDDMRYLYFTDSVDELAVYISSMVQKFGVIPRPLPSRILRETATDKKTDKKKSKKKIIEPA